MICLIIIGIIFIIDLLVKRKAETELEENKDYNYSGLILRKHHNYGAALNKGEKRPGLVIGVAALCCALIGLYLILRLTRGRTGMAELGLSFILGGAINNLYDRLSRGYVVDYFSFNVRWQGLRNIIFNISDMFIILGAVIAVIGEVAAELKA